MWCKDKLSSEFDMKDIGLPDYFLGVKAWYGLGEVFVGKGSTH